MVSGTPEDFTDTLEDKGAIIKIAVSSLVCVISGLRKAIWEATINRRLGWLRIVTLMAHVCSEAGGKVDLNKKEKGQVFSRDPQATLSGVIGVSQRNGNCIE